MTLFRNQNRGPETKAALFLEKPLTILCLVSIYHAVSNGPLQFRLFTLPSHHRRYPVCNRDSRVELQYLLSDFLLVDVVCFHDDILFDPSNMAHYYEIYPPPSMVDQPYPA